MIVLGIDTSTEQTSVALGTEQEILGTARFAGVRRHDDLLPAVERLLEWTGVELEHVGGVAVGIGPGLYTGLRVGVEAAKALAQVLGVPIVGIGSLDLLAFGTAPAGAYGDAASDCGAVQMLGDVWEWTSSDFTAYPGFEAFPYPEYSEVFFGDEYKVLRGGAWATRRGVIRTSFRNWDLPQRRQIFSGLRCVRTG